MLTALIFVIVLVTLFALIAWLVHISMVKDNTHLYGWASFKEFKEQFDNKNWDKENWSTFGLRDRKTNSRFFASIVQFNGNGMVLSDPISYLMAEFYARLYYRRSFAAKRNVVKWSKNK